MRNKASKTIVSGARRGLKLNNIIDELLLLASVRKETVERTPLPMADIMKQVIERLDGMIAEFEATLHVPEEWPVALGYAPWVEEVWVNYLSNAIKYGGKPPLIDIRTRLEANGQGLF
ncbi:MAG: hypothetical protein M5U34_29985 [Chloroflexi bacterium]|nr:hypothetical protein [Chloroflexota bacterium]